MSFRRTKIIATIGPATDDPKILEQIIKSGVNLVRINFSHGDKDTHLKRVSKVRSLAKKLGYTVGVLMDLQGPKIRTAAFKSGDSVYLAENSKFILNANLAEKAGNQKEVGISYKNLVQDVKVGALLALDDGKIILEVISIRSGKIYTSVRQGGILGSKKGINLKGGGLSAKALTSKDLKDILIAAEAKTDYLALSFVKVAEDVDRVRSLLKKANWDAGIVAKIERSEALLNPDLTKIIKSADAIMVARGDLGVEIGDAMLPAQQKRLIKMARSLDTAVITATQMMDSMIENPIPTRAETFDVANAVLDGTDAVMLSAETAIGKYPDKVVAAMSAICLEAEKSPAISKSEHYVNTQFKSTEETIALSAMYAANHLKVNAIASLTESGNTAKTISRISSSIPIFAISRHPSTINRITLFRGVYPLLINNKANVINIDKIVIELLQQKKLISKGDKIILTKGEIYGKAGTTNLLKILEI